MGEKPAEDQENEEPSGPPQRRIHDLVAEKATLDTEGVRELVADLIEELGEPPKRIGIEEAVEERLRFAEVTRVVS